MHSYLTFGLITGTTKLLRQTDQCTLSIAFDTNDDKTALDDKVMSTPRSGLLLEHNRAALTCFLNLIVGYLIDNLSDKSCVTLHHLPTQPFLILNNNVRAVEFYFN